MQVTSNQILSKEQLRIFIKQASNVDRGFGFQLKFILLAHITAQESCQLRWQDVDRTNDIITIRGSKDRSIEIVGEIKDLFSMWSREYYPFVFKYRVPGSISWMLKKTNAGLGWNVTLKQLKESYLILDAP